MHNGRGWTGAVVVPALTIAVLLLGARDGRAEDISGTVMRTVMLSENTRLVGDVTCRVTGGPCIAFGAPNIVLALNGLTMTGQADPDPACKGTPPSTELGISPNAPRNLGISRP